MSDLRMLAGVAVLAVALVGANQAAGAGKKESSVAPLTGEMLFAADMPLVGSSNVSGTCNLVGNSTFNFTVMGEASGPYPGTFTESGTFTVGPPLMPVLVSFNSTFTINSSAGTVDGTKTFTGPLNVGACGIAAFPPDGHSLQGTLSYTAEITTPTGSGTDSGTSVVTYQDTRMRLPGFNDFSFNEDFTSTAAPPCDDDDDGDNGGDCDDDEQ